MPEEFRVFGIHGTLDEGVAIEDGRAARDFMQSAGIEVTWSEFEGGHTILAEDLRAFQNWMRKE